MACEQAEAILSGLNMSLVDMTSSGSRIVLENSLGSCSRLSTGQTSPTRPRLLPYNSSLPVVPSFHRHGRTGVDDVELITDDGSNLVPLPIMEIWDTMDLGGGLGLEELL